MLTTNVPSATELYKLPAEKAVISSLILSPDLFTKAQEILGVPEAFKDYTCREAYKAILKLQTENQVVDYISVLSVSNLDSHKLSALISEHPMIDDYKITWEKVETYAKIVAEAFIKRQLYEKLQKGEDVKSMMETVAQLERSGADKFFSPKQIALQVLASFRRLNDSIDYPFPKLQTVTNGIHKGELIIVAARPGAGKTSLLENIGWYVAEGGQKVLFASAEMSAESLGKRIATRLSGYNLFFENVNDMSDEKKVLVKNAVEKVSQGLLYIYELYTVAQLEATIKEKARDFGLVIIDYLQLLVPQAKSKYQSEFERVTNVTNELTHLAKKYHLPFIVAAQYNRVAEKLQPTMADLKNTGQIEQNADVIISLWNHKDDLEIDGIKKVRMDILKNRNGPTIGNYDDTHQVYLKFDKHLFQFIDETPMPFVPGFEGIKW